ncbi:MAG: UvrD-helicase domain-containing protein, partial [Candidatus Heimdallarchaeota archaeon]|nr:UvrD-helicase domain-containing protein [Candidatus Heimdallarchaeota archaeon]
MGISAVPGSGKTWTLSLLAAEIIKEGLLTANQEVLIVTLVNSAVNNFSTRISHFLETFNLIPSLGYRVRTLHGLAHDIVKERPDLAGLDSSFQIIDDREAERIRNEAIYSWLRNNSKLIDSYLIEDLNSNKKESLYQKQIPTLLDQTVLQFIRSAKNLHLTPLDLDKYLEPHQGIFPLAEMGLEIYRVYQRNLEYRGAVDF